MRSSSKFMTSEESASHPTSLWFWRASGTSCSPGRSPGWTCWPRSSVGHGSIWVPIGLLGIGVGLFLTCSNGRGSVCEHEWDAKLPSSGLYESSGGNQVDGLPPAPVRMQVMEVHQLRGSGPESSDDLFAIKVFEDFEKTQSIYKKYVTYYSSCSINFWNWIII